MTASELCVRVLSYLIISLFLRCISCWAGLRARIHERLCELLALNPAQVFEHKESAVVIVGGDDDVGRHLSLGFSELGCTVFALFPDKPTAAPHSEAATRDASSVSSFIQEWHQRIKRSGRSPWGLVAPIVLDMTSGTQRAHAVETVAAYCATHNLHLVAVIVLPTNAPAPPKPLVSDHADVAAWAEIVRRCLMEPVSVVHEYLNLLAAASGRVVLLKASGDQLGVPSAQLSALDSAAQFIRREVGSLGIKVSIVSAGPFAPAYKPSAPMVNVASPAGTLASSERAEDDGATVRGIIQDVLHRFFVRYEDVWRVVYDITRSRHPRERYAVGIYAALEELHRALPAALRLFFA